MIAICVIYILPSGNLTTNQGGSQTSKGAAGDNLNITQAMNSFEDALAALSEKHPLNFRLNEDGKIYQTQYLGSFGRWSLVLVPDEHGGVTVVAVLPCVVSGGSCH